MVTLLLDRNTLDGCQATNTITDTELPRSRESGGLLYLLVQSIYYFDPSQIATEGFPALFISLKYIDQHMKSLEKSKKGKIQFFTETI